MGAVVKMEGKQLDLVRRTVAKDCNAAEFDLFIHTCKAVRLDPLRRQIYAFVFSKDDPKKRQMTIVTSIGGYRSIAERTGSYRPGRTETFFDAAMKDPATNPQGISHATATVFKYIHGEWHAIEESAYWTEFAPIKEIWENREPTGKFQLDRKKEGWTRMPRVMIEKCAEAKALRRGWPDDFDGLYSEDEIAQAHTLDLTATELADAAASEDRISRIGGPSITILWNDNEPLQRVPVGQAADRVLEFIAKNSDEPSAIAVWEDRNRFALQELWALDKSAGLEVKKALEAARSLLSVSE